MGKMGRLKQENPLVNMLRCAIQVASAKVNKDENHEDDTEGGLT